MPEQGANRDAPGNWRVICPHGKGKEHCTGQLLHFRVIRKRPRHTRRTKESEWR
jgi:hypothetical protein